MTHLQTIQTTNNVSPNIHENSKLQIKKHKVTILSKICNLNKNLNRKSKSIRPKANKPQEPNLEQNQLWPQKFCKLSHQQFMAQISHLAQYSNHHQQTKLHARCIANLFVKLLESGMSQSPVSSIIKGGMGNASLMIISIFTKHKTCYTLGVST